MQRVQWVHEPVDLWDITFCTQRFKFEAHSINKASVVLYDKSHLYRNVLKHIHATFANNLGRFKHQTYSGCTVLYSFLIWIFVTVFEMNMDIL